MISIHALQDWLALEHQAVWLYPVIGAQLDRSAEAASKAYNAHRAVRDNLFGRLHALDAEPVAAQLAYDVGPVRTTAQARAAAQRVERRIAAACLTLAGASSGDGRAYAISGLRRAALAELSWGARPNAFPGLA